MTCSCSSHNGFLTAKGLREAAKRSSLIRGLDARRYELHLDKVGSVSAMVEVEHDCDYDSKHVELNHRSSFLQLEIF